ncbi:MAG TPA: sugar-binding domain-containing protein [Rectinemataceae bacterium]|nr:sugar-binding domain-containing protein [Rectinemataceae bacterium]
MDEHLNNSLLTRIAWLYYYEDKSQQEIGELLGIPRIKVVRLLKVIRERKIVEIKIARRYVSLFELEKEFSEATGLTDITIVPSGANPGDNVAYAAALRFADMCKRYESIGLGSSRALSASLALVEAPKKLAVKRIVSLTGSTMPNYAVNASNPSSSGILLSRSLGIDYFHIWAPAIASTKETAHIMRNDHVLASILSMANAVDCAMIGLGSVKNSVLVSRGFITAKDIEELASRGAVGDVFTHFFTLDGARVPSAVEERSVTADVPLRCPVTAVAYGEDKVLAIAGAIRGKLISGIVTDEKTASAAIEAFRTR